MRIAKLGFAGLVLLAACSKGDNAATDSAAGPATIGPATSDSGTTAAVRDAAGRELGSVTLSDAAGGIMVMGTLRGLAPGDHGIHLHMTGSCEPTFDAAGGHWNPTSKKHGTGNTDGPHLGDLQNITVGADSSVSIHVTTPGGTLRGENMLLDADGAAVVVHATSDDNNTDPSGNSGARIACGAIKG